MQKLITFILLILSLNVFSQAVYQHIDNTDIYEFLDELANDGIIQLNTTIKPYTRALISQKLNEAAKSTTLNERQKKEIAFYLKDYYQEMGKLPDVKLRMFGNDTTSKLAMLPPGVFYKDNLFSFTLKPILGYKYIVNAKNKMYQSWGGADAYASVGGHWGFYASLRDNYQNKEIQAMPSYFTLEQGGNYKINEGGRSGGDYSEMRGGITYAWNWGEVGVVKDNVQWGEGYHGTNIFSGRTPSFAMIKLHVNPAKWFDFNYYHGWLVSEVIDSSRSYITTNGDYRAVYQNKYIASNMFTFYPWKGFNLSIGNSIIYSDMDVQLAYLIPVFFYKSVDHTINHGIDNQNSQMFFSLSSRNIKHLHLYTTIYVDEFSIKRITEANKYNFVSDKVGFRVSNWFIKNTEFTSEYTRTYPITYEHRVPSLTFETNQFNLGNYLRDNSQEIFASLAYKIKANISIKASYNYAVHYNNYPYLTGLAVDAMPFFTDKTWTNSSFIFNVSWRPIPNSQIFVEYMNSNINGYKSSNSSLTSQDYLNLYTPAYLHGNNNTITIGMNYGL